VASIQKRYAYCMGANHPQGFVRLQPLQYAERDAELLARAFLDSPCSFTEARYAVANNYVETVIELDNFLKNPALQEQDLVVVHFSGHGHIFENGRFYLLCNQTDASKIDISAIEIDLIKRRLAECPARYKLLILDCCHAGSAIEGVRGEQDIGEELDRVLRGSSNVILAACSRLETTRELPRIDDDEDGGGVLTWIVRKACTSRIREASISGDDRALSLRDIQHWIPEIIRKINSGLKTEDRLPEPRAFYEEQGGAEIWLTEERRSPLSKGVPSQTDHTDYLQNMIAHQRDFIDDRMRRFVGREAELQALRARIDGKLAQGGYLVVTGDAGQGKSSLLAKMIEQQGIDTTAYHFVQYNSGDDFRRSLLLKIMARLTLKHNLPEFYTRSEAYPSLSGNFPLVLDEVAKKGAQEVIYIDGIDQLITGAIDEQGLGFLPAKLPHGIVIVIGTRPNDTLKELEPIIGTPKLDLVEVKALSFADFELLLQPREEPLSPHLIRGFYDALKGNALYLDLLAQELNASNDTPPDDLIARLENNPNHIFTFTFSRLKRLDAEWHHVIRPLLGTLLVAREALTRQQIGQICGVESYRIRDEGILRLGGLLTHLSHDQVTLFHSKLTEYLKENPDRPTDAYEFDLAEVQDWHGKLANWCGQGTNEQLWSSSIDPPGPEDYRAYARKHYVAHLHDAGYYEKLFAVLDTKDYEYGKLQADPSTRSTVLDLLLGCEDAAHVVTLLREDAPPAKSLGSLARLWRYTLLRCSLATQADTYPIEAFQALLALDREQQALDLAELLTQPMRRLDALLIVMQQLLSQPEREAEGLQLYDRVYEIATTIADPHERVKAFGHLVATLQLARQEDRARDCWQEASTAANAFTDPLEQAIALHDLAEAYIQAHLWEQAKTTARLIDSLVEQIDVWGQLALALRQVGLTEQADAASTEMQMLVSSAPRHTRQAALDRERSLSAQALAHAGQLAAQKVAEEIRNDTVRDITLVRIAARLVIADADLWESSWQSIEDIVQRYARRGRTLSQLANILVDLSIELSRQQRWEQARAVATVMSDKDVQCRALMGIVSQLAWHGLRLEAEKDWRDARELCTAQIDQVEAQVTGIAVSALVKAEQVTQARTITDAIQDDQIREHVRSEFAIALARIKERAEARKTADSIIDLQDRDRAYSGIALALMQAGESEQAQTLALAIEDRNQRMRILNELVTICCNKQLWAADGDQFVKAAESTADLIDDLNLQAAARNCIISGLVRDGLSKDAEAVYKAISHPYFRLRAICDLAIASAQLRSIGSADKYIRLLKRNADIQKKAECNLWIAAKILTNAESTAKTISEGDERREALCNVAMAYANSQMWDKADEIVAMINDRERQDEAWAVLAIELARAGQWERAITTFDIIDKNSGRRMVNQRMFVLQAWGDFLAQPGSREQREKTVHALTESKEKACLLLSVVDKLAQPDQYTEQLHVIQQAWLQARTKDDCLSLFAIVRRLILRAPEMGAAFYNVFTWVNTFLGQ
jgi:tetratricopeptide (TPR) repeat protein